MPSTLRNRAARAGLAPGTLQGNVPASPDVQVHVFEYASGQLSSETSLSALADISSERQVWIHVQGRASAEQLEVLGKKFSLHALVLEDIQNTDQRPKLDVYENYLFFVLRSLSFNEEQRIETHQFSIVLGENFVLSFQDEEGDMITPLVDRLKNAKSRLRVKRSDYLAYSLIDLIVDNYFVVLDTLWNKIEFLEGRILKAPTQASMYAVQKLKRNLIQLRKTVWPMREMVSDLEHTGHGFFEKDTFVYLRDVYDHCNHAVDTLETFRELVSGLLDMYISTINNRTNEVMKMLTIIATIFIPLTFVTGVFGMNFKDMPILDYPWAFPATMLVMLLLALSMLVFFRRRRWL